MAVIMESADWELLVDNRFKYARSDPLWHTVSIGTATNFPLKSQLKTQNCVLAARYKVYLPHILNYDVRSDDIWIISYPRSGTTWAQEMVWLVNNDFDFQNAQNALLTQRSPTLRDIILDTLKVKQTVPDICTELNNAKGLQPPYHIKNHLPAAFLPNKIWTVKPKIVYVARNPKDAAISYYHYYKLLHGYEGSMDEFLGLYLDGKNEFGSQTSHILDFWNLRNEENILFLTFEEMKNDLKSVIKNVAAFLGKAINDNQLGMLNEYLQFCSMRERAGSLLGIENTQQNLKGAAKQFFRRGECGSYKDEMNEKMIEKFNEHIERELTAKGCHIYASKC